MSQTLTNGLLTIAVEEHGAELSSLRCGNREYLWQADPAFWKRHSPVLFPIVGAVWGGAFRTGGVEYPMGQHGLARDLDFRLIRQSADEVQYELLSTSDTLQRYPYPFRLVIGYRLDGHRVRVSWQVENPGTAPLSFQIGAHPAFYWPMLTDAQIAEGVPAMLSPLADSDQRGFFRLTADQSRLPLSVITQGGCVGAAGEVQLDAEGYLPLDVHTFDRDALILEDSHVSRVTICRQDRTPYLTLEFSSPLVGLWSPPGKRAPFVCIEPWYGRTDAVGYDGTYEDKPWMQHLAPGQTFAAYYDIIVE